MMDHEVIVNNYTAERYLLGELTEAEREAYEEHYFDCADCAEEVLYGSEFMQIAREVCAAERDGRQPETGPTPAWRSRWFRPAAMAACGLLAAGLGVGIYQNFRTGQALKENESAQIVSSTFTLALTRSRSIEDGPVPANQPVRLRFAIPPDHYQAYRSVVVGPSGEEKFPRVIRAEEISAPVDLRLAARSLQPGDYAVVINGIKEDSTLDKDKEHEVRFPFRVVEKIIPKN